MLKVTSVEPQKKSANRRIKRFNIFLDGEFAFGADEDLVVDFRLIPGKIIDPQDLEKLLQEAEVGKIMERMYRLFNIRSRSEKEIRDKLRTKNYELRIKGKEPSSDLVIRQVIKTLKRKGFLDDEKFARAWVESRSKKYGSQRIKQELYKKGIDREIIDRIMNQELRITGEEVAEKLLEKRLARWTNLPILEFKKKAYEFLLRRGFDYEIVKKVVEKLTKKE